MRRKSSSIFSMSLVLIQVSFLVCRSLSCGANLFLGDYVFFDVGLFPMRAKNSSMLKCLFCGIQVSLLVWGGYGQ